MKSLTNATIIQTGKSKRIKPKQFNHSNIKARDDFKSNAVNGVKLKKHANCPICNESFRDTLSVAITGRKAVCFNCYNATVKYTIC